MQYDICVIIGYPMTPVGLTRLLVVQGHARTYEIFYFQFSSGLFLDDFEVYADNLIYVLVALRCPSGSDVEASHL